MVPAETGLPHVYKITPTILYTLKNHTNNWFIKIKSEILNQQKPISCPCSKDSHKKLDTLISWNSQMLGIDAAEMLEHQQVTTIIYNYTHWSEHM